MSETTNNLEIPQEEREMTPAQMVEFRKKAKAYYNDQSVVLKAQLEYESLLADIEEARTKRLTMTIRMAQMMAGPPKETEKGPVHTTPSTVNSEETSEERPVRKLKTQE
tara:strand:+ start:1046 stop:1372 length:327 start_codon:yes stop_codon:yes gene_type:complete